MGFKPGKSVVFLSDDGTELVVRPFFFTTGIGGGIDVDLFADDGTRIQCIDKSNGIYTLGESGKQFHLKTDPPMTAS